MDSLSDPALRRLSLPLGVLLAAAAVSALLLTVTGNALEAARERQQRQRNALQAETQRVHKAADEKALIERYREAYAALQRQGFIGDEQRINWVDALRNANLSLNLFGIDYSIGAQQPYVEPVQSSGALQLRESPMRLSLKLLHEEDVLRFFDYLAAQQVGVFHPRSCILQRIDANGGPALAANIEATCEIAWITAQPPGAVGQIAQ